MKFHSHMHPRAQELLVQLALQPHPEGGFYREIYRSSSSVQPADARDARRALTTIYFLLPAGMHSRWHRVTSDEVWHFYEGDALELWVGDPSLQNVTRIRLEAPSANGGPVYTVPAGYWQAARPLGEYSLTGCTVAPGFEFADFTFLRDSPELVASLEASCNSGCALI